MFADDLGMKGSKDPRIETRRLDRRGERTVEVRVIEYPATPKSSRAPHQA